MKKQMNSKIFKAMLSILVLALMLGAVCAAMLIATAGEETPKKTLTLTWEGDALNYVGECVVTYTPAGSSSAEVRTFKLSEIASDEKSVSMEISEGASVKIKIIPKVGKMLKLRIAADSDDIKEIGNTFDERNYSWTESTQTIQFDKYNFDSVVTMRSCTNREYAIKVVNFNAVDEESFGYTPMSPYDDDWWQDLTKGKQTFVYDNEPITLPGIRKTGYDFVGWRVRTNESFTGSATVGSSAIEDGKINNNVVHNNDYAQDNGVIYIYPHMTPKVQDFYRYDHVFDPTLTGFRGDRLSDAIKGNALMEEKITGLNKTLDEAVSDTYTAYAGYILHVCDEDCEKQHYPEVTVNDSTQATNIVYRLYEPIQYQLSFLNVTGYTPASSVYSYGTTTEIADPVRMGYTFRGWQVEVYRSGAWVAVDNDGKDINGVTITDIGFALGDKKAAVIGGVATEIRNGVELTIGGTYSDPNAIYASEMNAEGAYEIRLTAVWEANTYGIVYDFGGVELDGDLLHNATLPTEFTFDELNADGVAALAIVNPLRAGYTFRGWSIEVYADDAWVPVDGDEDAENGISPASPDFVLATGKYAYDIRLTAIWEANTYSVTLNGNGATEEGTGAIDSVTFDTQLILPDGFTVPTREGHTFDGFWSATEGGEQYIDANGDAVVTPWKLYEAVDGNVVLYARWIVNDYNVIVNVTLPDGLLASDVIAELLCKGTDGAWGAPVAIGDTGIAVPFGTEYRIRITLKDGFKIVSAGMTAETVAEVAHSNPYLSDVMVMRAENVTLYAVALPMIADPTEGLVIDYKSETLGGLPNGTYLIYYEGLQLNVTVNSGEIKVNDEAVGAIAIPDEFFGKTNVLLICIGDGVTNADSDAFVLSFAARPEEPKKDIDNINNTEQDRLTVVMKDGVNLEDYEFAVWDRNDLANLNEACWQDSPVLAEILGEAGSEPLRPGTRYYIFVRVKATDTAPHGKVYVTEPYMTASRAYINDSLTKLDELLGEYGAGPIVSELINGAKDQISSLESGNVYVEVETIIESVIREIELAQWKDERILELGDMLKSFPTDAYTPANFETLKDIYSKAVEEIAALTEKDDAIYNAAILDMGRVSVTYLFGEGVSLESLLGLPSGTSISLTLQNLDVINQAVIDSIRAGKISVGGFMTFAEAERTLRELDVVTNYSLKLIGGAVKNGDTLVIRLALTDDLKNYSGLRVAYYNEATGMLELLESEMSEDGNELIFYASRVADFVLLADATVDLFGVIAALGAVLLFQIIAIIALVVSRIKSKKRATHACVAFPTAALAIRFAPVNAEVLVMIMAALAIVLQVVLMVLLLTSYAEYHGRVKKAKKDKTGGDAVAAAMAMLAADDTDEAEELPLEETEDYFVDDSENEELTEELTEEYYEEDEEATDVFEEDAEEDPFAMYDEEEDVIDDESYVAEESDEDGDFIEPAPATRYSLEDEEAFAIYDDEALTEEEFSEEEFSEEEFSEEEISEEALYGEEELPEDEALYEDEILYEDEEASEETSTKTENSDGEEDSLYRYDE